MSIAIAASVDALAGLLMGGMHDAAIAHIPSLDRLKEIVNEVCADEEEGYAFFGYIPFESMKALHDVLGFNRDVLTERNKDRRGDILIQVMTSAMYRDPHVYTGFHAALRWILATFPYTHAEIEEMDLYTLPNFDAEAMNIIDARYRFDRCRMREVYALLHRTGPINETYNEQQRREWLQYKLETDPYQQGSRTKGAGRASI